MLEEMCVEPVRPLDSVGWPPHRRRRSKSSTSTAAHVGVWCQKAAAPRHRRGSAKNRGVDGRREPSWRSLFAALLSTAFHRLPLPFTAFHRLSLPFTAFPRLSPPFTDLKLTFTAYSAALGARTAEHLARAAPPRTARLRPGAPSRQRCSAQHAVRLPHHSPSRIGALLCRAGKASLRSTAC